MKNMNKFLIKLLSFGVKIIFLPLLLLGILIPKKKNIWIFGSWSGKSYSDNSRALFEFANSKKDIRAIWLTRNKKIITILKEKKMEVYNFFSLKGFYFSLISGVAVMSTSWIDLPISSFFSPFKTKFIQLWHGTPLKRMDLKAGSLVKQILRFVFLAYMGKEYDMVISATERNVMLYEKIFCIDKEKIKITGQPRNDLIFLNKKFFHEKKNIEKIYLYMPTWRDYEFNVFENGFKPEYFSQFLKDNKILFVIKIHPNEIKKYKNKLNYNNIVFWEIKDAYPYLSNFDVLLTDYSSIYFDFLILNRPIIFAPFDFEKYSQKNGFYYNYNSVTPGPKAKNWEEVIEIMQELLSGIDNYKEKRLEINKEFNKFTDNKNSERVYTEILKYD